ncbi:DUF6838 family protein [Clostridium ihumii]|uniref:DUF6838 family protein n=1 Tax=Clostridium ihumii TaxID=1470356 RepID=UPI00058C94BB|nr:hypothetical protein [Clostridium ihumii]
MRHGIRQKLIESDIGILNCYEPNIPNKQTIKPYAVVVQNDDTKNNEAVGFKRTIEVWFYVDKTSFKELDKIVEKAIKALHMQTIEDVKTKETFTCIFNGIVGQDGIDEEWDALYRGLQFTVIALHDDEEINTDSWLDALKDFTKEITDIEVYQNTWKKNFKDPSILWRVSNTSKERINSALIKESKTLICHIVSNNKNEINKLLDTIEDKLITDLKIPLDIKDKRYLTIESIEEDREADMLSKGQLTVKFFKRKMIDQKEVPTIEKIYGRGNLE